MKSKIIIAAVVVAILGSFAFITIDKNTVEKKATVENTTNQTMSGIVKEDTNF